MNCNKKGNNSKGSNINGCSRSQYMTTAVNFCTISKLKFDWQIIKQQRMLEPTNIYEPKLRLQSKSIKYYLIVREDQLLNATIFFTNAIINITVKGT